MRFRLQPRRPPRGAPAVKHVGIEDGFFVAMGDLHDALTRTLELYPRLQESHARSALTDADRAEAIAAAKQMSQRALTLYDGVVLRWGREGVIGVWLPSRIMDGVGRYSYALAALAATDPGPDPEALLSAEEFDTVLDLYDLRRWFEPMSGDDGEWTNLSRAR